VNLLPLSSESSRLLPENVKIEVIQSYNFVVVYVEHFLFPLYLEKYMEPIELKEQEACKTAYCIAS